MKTLPSIHIDDGRALVRAAGVIASAPPVVTADDAKQRLAEIQELADAFITAMETVTHDLDCSLRKLLGERWSEWKWTLDDDVRAALTRQLGGSNPNLPRETWTPRFKLDLYNDLMRLAGPAEREAA